MPVWNTETGFEIVSSPNAVDPWVFSPGDDSVLDAATSQEFVARTYLVSWAIGFQRVLLYSWANNQYDIVDDTGHTSKPATVAYGEVANLMMGSMLLSYSTDSVGTWTLIAQDATGSPMVILWNANELTKTATIQPSWKVSQANDLNGNPVSMSGGLVSFAGLPIILR
jgi:hypothetical protein